MGTIGHLNMQSLSNKDCRSVLFTSSMCGVWLSIKQLRSLANWAIKSADWLEAKDKKTTSKKYQLKEL